MLKVFSKVRPKIKSKFKKFNLRISSKTRGSSALKSLVKKDSLLRKTIKSVFTKKGALAIGATTAIGIGIAKIQEYIDANSGCFLFQNDDNVCKVKSLSCCQNNLIAGVNFCREQDKRLEKVCEGFDENDPNAQESCCLLCDCRSYGGCLPGETMECRRPTVAEAISFYAQGAVTGFASWIWTLIPVWIIFGVVFLILFVVMVQWIWTWRKTKYA